MLQSESSPSKKSIIFNVRIVNKVVDPNLLKRLFIFNLILAIFTILAGSGGRIDLVFVLLMLMSLTNEFCSNGRDCNMLVSARLGNSSSEFEISPNDLLGIARAIIGWVL